MPCQIEHPKTHKLSKVEFLNFINFSSFFLSMFESDVKILRKVIFNLRDLRLSHQVIDSAWRQGGRMLIGPLHPYQLVTILFKLSYWST